MTFPYTRGDICSMTGVSVPTLKNLVRGNVIKKKAKGTGNYLAFNFEDALRVAVAKELLRVGLEVSSIHSLFASIKTPEASRAKPWSWLRTKEARRDGAALILILGHPLAPANTSAYLTTAREAVALMQQSKRTVVTVDVGAFILELEQRTGEQYG